MTNVLVKSSADKATVLAMKIAGMVILITIIPMLLFLFVARELVKIWAVIDLF